MAIRRSASRALSAGERAANKAAISGSRARTARRRIEAERAMRKGARTRA